MRPDYTGPPNAAQRARGIAQAVTESLRHKQPPAEVSGTDRLSTKQGALVQPPGQVKLSVEYYR